MARYRARCIALMMVIGLTICTKQAGWAAQNRNEGVVVAAQHDLLKNGGFEEGDDLPAFWSRHPKRNNDRNEHFRDIEVHHSGMASGGLRWLDPIAGTNKAPLQWNKYGLPVEGGCTLIFSGCVKTDGVDPGGAGIHFYDSDGTHVGHGPIPCPKTKEEWQHFTKQINAPETAASMGIALYAREGGTTWYDDVSLLGTPRLSAVRGTPELDGDLQDDCWRTENAVADFVTHDGQRLSKEATRAWVAYDDENLYVAFDCPHAATAQLKQEATSEDGDTWLDDSIEIFFDPWHAHKGYYQLAINCAGVVRDSIGSDIVWDSGATTKAVRHKTGWTLEVAIPFRSLDLDLKSREVWGINLVRNDRVNGETVTWSLGGFHQPGRFGNVALKPNLLKILVSQLAGRVAKLPRELECLEGEIKSSGISRSRAPEAYQGLDDVGRTIRELASAMESPDEINEPQFQNLKTRFAAVLDELDRIYKAASIAPFSTGKVPDGKGFHVVVASSMRKAFRTDDVVSGIIRTRVQLEAARDEVESFQLVVVPSDGNLEGVEVETSPLQGEGKRIPVEWCRVEYVETAPPKGYFPERVGWWPDILMPPAPFDVAKEKQQPVWVRVTVPPDAAAGDYKGEVTVRHAGHSVSVPVELRVRDFGLPRPGSLACPFGLYPGTLSAFYYGNAAYQDVMPPEEYAKWCEYLGKYRLTPKNVANDYHKVTGDPGRGGSYDLSNLNITIKPFASKYYPPYSFCLFRLPCGEDVRMGTTKADPKVWAQAAKARREAYQREDLPESVYIYGIDEPSEKAYGFLADVYRMVKEVAPEYPIMQTVNRTIPEELSELVDIWCPLSAALERDMDFYKERQREGDQLWMYICCSPKPPYANFFVDQPAIDHRVLFWQARQKGVTGVLLWVVSYWRGLPGPTSGGPHFPEVPVRFAENMDSYQIWGGNGDGTLIWPGPDMTPYPSIRLEVIRDGIEDYEYLALLSRCVAKAKQLPEGERPDDALLKEAEALCEVPDEISESFIRYTKDSQVLMERRKKVGDMIEQLVAKLGCEPEPERPTFPK